MNTTATASASSTVVLSVKDKFMSDDPQSDAIWILSSTFIIFTMQSGFGLLESGIVTVKNEANIMVKNTVDVIFGGFTYYMFGYGLSFGEEEPYANMFCGWGNFFVNAAEDELGWVYSRFFFQASFATTATTIVSGAMAERTKLGAYMVFSVINTLIFSFPAHWVWGEKGWLFELGVVDIAGAGPVHMVGGITGLVATILLKPRHDRFKSDRPPPMGSPTNAVLGMFMLWWGWLGFNCGSTFGISGIKWILAARSAVSTICASFAGGTTGIILSYFVNNKRFDIGYIINGILGSLVGITALCAMAHPWEGILIGCVGALVVNGGVELLNKLKIDDPVGCVGTHAIGGIWSLLSAGLFSRKDTLADALQHHRIQNGLFHGGGFSQLGIQAIAVVSIAAWTVVVSLIFLKVIDFLVGIRMPLVEELIGADIVEHGIGNIFFDKKTARVVDFDKYNIVSLEDVPDENKADVQTVMALYGRRGSGMLGHHHILTDDEIVAYKTLLFSINSSGIDNSNQNNKMAGLFRKFRFGRSLFTSSNKDRSLPINIKCKSHSVRDVESGCDMQECFKEEMPHNTNENRIADVRSVERSWLNRKERCCLESVKITPDNGRHSTSHDSGDVKSELTYI